MSKIVHEMLIKTWINYIGDFCNFIVYVCIDKSVRASSRRLYAVIIMNIPRCAIRRIVVVIEVDQTVSHKASTKP